MLLPSYALIAVTGTWRRLGVGRLFVVVNLVTSTILLMGVGLVYGTAGVAVAETELTLDGVSDANTSAGYTVGAGVEARITDSIGTRLEYRYSDYGSSGYDFPNTSVSSGFDEHSVRAGINLKF